MTNKNILIIGVGNPFRGDDGIGPQIIKQLHDNGGLDNTELMDGGTDGLALLDYIKEHEKVIIVDAVSMGCVPGTVKVFTPEEVIMNTSSEALSTHGFGLAEVINLMEKLEIKTELKIVGIEPKNVIFSDTMSDEVEGAIGNVIDVVEDLVKKMCIF